MTSLLEQITSYIPVEMITKSATELGESNSTISKGLSGLIPAVLAGMADRSSDDTILETMFDMIDDTKTADFLGQLTDLVGMGNIAQDDPRDISGNLIGRIYGNKVPDILSAITSFAGLKEGSASTLLGLVGPLVMGVLNKKVKEGFLSASGLQKLLVDHKARTYSAVPNEVRPTLDIEDLKPATTRSTVTKDVSVAATTIQSSEQTIGNFNVEEDQGEGKRKFGWLWPVLILLALGSLLFMCARDREKEDTTSKTVSEPIEVTPPVVEDVNGTLDILDINDDDTNTYDTVDVEPDIIETDTNDATRHASLDLNDYDITGDLNGVEAKLIAFINSDRAPCTVVDCWFTMDRVTFNSGSSSLDLEKSRIQLNNIKNIMDSHPNIALKLGGYTDSSGSSGGNQRLSQKRADAVVAALINIGVDANRLDAEGYGEEFPIASNDTKEGRALNRRIDIRISKR